MGPPSPERVLPPLQALLLPQPRFRGFLWSGVPGSPTCLPESLRTVALCWVRLPGADAVPGDTGLPTPRSRLSLRLFHAALSMAGTHRLEARHLRPEGPFLSCPQETLHFLPPDRSLAGDPRPPAPAAKQEPGPGGWKGRPVWCLRSRVVHPPELVREGRFSRTRGPLEAETRPTWQQRGTWAKPGLFWFVLLSIRTPKRVG